MRVLLVSGAPERAASLRTLLLESGRATEVEIVASADGAAEEDLSLIHI